MKEQPEAATLRSGDFDSPTPSSVSDGTNQIDALSERVRNVAVAAGEEALQVMRHRAGALLEQARTDAACETRERLALVRKQLQKRSRRELQDARLDGRARIAIFRWAELDRVMNEAEEETKRVRRDAPERYARALELFLESAVKEIGGDRFLIKVNPEDMDLLEGRLAGSDVQFQWSAVGSASGFEVGTPEGTVSVDQSIQGRRQRQEEELRLMATGILFNDSRATQPDGGESE